MNPNLLTEFSLFGQHLADHARDIALSFFRNLKSVQYKKDNSPVTMADREIETKIRELIMEKYPKHAVFGEECTPISSEEPWTWVIDPIDGTRSFISGKPTFGCLIALLYEQKPMLGIIEMPALKERWLGVYESNSTHNGISCYTNQSRALSEATVFATSIDMFETNEQTAFDHVSLNAQFRNFGADCYAYGLLASGYTDIVMESSMAIHDFLALVPVVEGAGGCISDWQGKPLNFGSGKQVLATANSSLHEECLHLINNN